MKKLMFIFAILPTIVFGQLINDTTDKINDSKKVSVDYTLYIGTLGFIMDVDYDNVKSIDQGLSPAFGLGLTANFIINKTYSLLFSPSIYFGTRNLKFKEARIGWNPGNNTINKEMNFETTYLQFPFSLKYKLKQKGNRQPYIIGGGNFVYDIMVNNGLVGGKGPLRFKLNPQDLFVELGMGFQFHRQKNDFSTEIKLSYGLMNILDSGHSATYNIIIINSLNSTMVNLIFKI